MNRKRVIYIGILFIITVIVSITTFSYAFLTRVDEQHGKLNMVVGDLNYSIESSDLSNNSITLSAGEGKEIEITIKANNEIDTKYQLYTNDVEDVTIGYLDEEGFNESTGTISKSGTKIVKVVLDNTSDISKTITFGVQGGFEHNTITLASNRSSIPEGEGLCRSGIAYEFDYNGTNGTDGSVQEFTAKCAGVYKVELWGAQGGTHDTVVGTGGYTKGLIDLPKNTRLYVYVGGAGESYTDTAGTYAGGYNGGGAVTFTQTTRKWATGGGATDIRYFGDTTPSSSDLLWNSQLGLNSRIMVAGAGGGHGYYHYSDTCVAGSAGGLNGYDAIGHYAAATNVDYGQGLGAKQTEGGWTTRVVSGDSINGKLDPVTKGSFGAATGVGAYEYGYTAGGSGYYAGGSSMHVEDGGGGSSYISGYLGSLAIAQGSTTEPRTLKSGCTTSSRSVECSTHYSGLYFTEAVMIDGKGCNWSTGSATNCGANQPQPNGTNTVGHSGNGYARITYIGYPECETGYVTNFDYTGDVQTFTAKCNGTYKLETWGAQGGNSKISNGTIYAGGAGGYSVGNIDLTKNSNLYIVVGGAGENSYNVNATTHNGGFNGGGNTRSYACASGGGATHIATSLLSTGELKNYSDARDKILLVAGGGGGSAGDLNGGGYSIGGAGGGLSGINATPGTGYMDNTWGSGGVGGTQTTGFAFGQGASSDTLLISGGGSGWYGGADGTHLRLSTYPTGTSWEAAGGGGSGYIGGVINGQTIAGNQTITEPNGTTTTGHIGNGYARITYLGD